MPHADTPSVARARRASPPWIASMSSIAATVTSAVATSVTPSSFRRGARAAPTGWRIRAAARTHRSTSGIVDPELPPPPLELVEVIERGEVLVAAGGRLRADDVLECGDLDGPLSDACPSRRDDQLVVAARAVRNEPDVQPPELGGHRDRHRRVEAALVPARGRRESLLLEA